MQGRALDNAQKLQASCSQAVLGFKVGQALAGALRQASKAVSAPGGGSGARRHNISAQQGGGSLLLETNNQPQDLGNPGVLLEGQETPQQKLQE